MAQLLRVGVDDWVVGCCLEPPAIGQVVEWQLQFHQHAVTRQTAAAETLQHLQAVAVPLAVWDGQTLDRHPVLLKTAAGASLYWESTEPQAGELLLSGSISISQHGEAPAGLPAVRAVVRRVRLMSTVYSEQPAGSGSWEPVQPLDVQYEDVQAAPKWFPHAPLSNGPTRLTNKALVDLELLDRGPSSGTYPSGLRL